MKKIHEEKKLDLLADKDLSRNYDRIEVGEMVQVALLCTQYQPAHRPKMSEVVRMLEGDGLAEKWEASQKNSTQTNPCQNGKQNQHALESNTTTPHDGGGEHGTATIFPMMGDDDNEDGHDVEAMELSGPR